MSDSAIPDGPSPASTSLPTDTRAEGTPTLRVVPPPIVLWLLPLIGLAIVGLLAARVYQERHYHGAAKLTTPFQAVLLINGQAFFGRLEGLDSDHPILRDVYYIQSQQNPETKQVTNMLVKRGREWHGPDRMILNKQHLLLVEPVREDSQVAKLIEEQKKQQR